MGSFLQQTTSFLKITLYFFHINFFSKKMKKKSRINPLPKFLLNIRKVQFYFKQNCAKLYTNTVLNCLWQE